MTEAGLCNLALLRVGQRQTIGSLADSTPEAKACATAFANARDVVLAAFDWPWATRRAELAVVADATRTGWTYVYAAPADMHEPCYIWSGVRAPANDERIPMAIEDGDGDTTGQVILTDKEDAELVYITNALPIGRYPPLVADALAWLMAADLALGLVNNARGAPNLRSEGLRVLGHAFARELAKQQRDVEPESEFVRGR